MEVGNDTMDGFLIGLRDRIPRLMDEMQGIASVVPSFAMPDGQVMALPQGGAPAPAVNVYIGSERLDARMDFRITRANKERDRIAFQGVRR